MPKFTRRQVGELNRILGLAAGAARDLWDPDKSSDENFQELGLDKPIADIFHEFILTLERFPSGEKLPDEEQHYHYCMVHDAIEAFFFCHESEWGEGYALKVQEELLGTGETGAWKRETLQLEQFIFNVTDGTSILDYSDAVETVEKLLGLWFQLMDPAYCPVVGCD